MPASPAAWPAAASASRSRSPRPRRLSLAAHGPVGLDVAYDLAATKGGSEVRASISVRSGKGITGRLLAEATNALLSAGALTHAISRLAAEAACPA